MSKADMRQANYDGDDQNRKCKLGCCSREPCVKENKRLIVCVCFYIQNKEENKINIWSLNRNLSSRWSRFLTRTDSGKEKKPKEAENGCSHHLVDGSRMDFLVQFGRQVSVVHVVPVRQVFE